MPIERFINQKIRRVKLEGFDYQYTALFEEEKARPETVLSGQSARGAHSRRLFLWPRPEALKRGPSRFPALFSWDGTDGGGRTHTSFRILDFESSLYLVFTTIYDFLITFWLTFQPRYGQISARNGKAKGIKQKVARTNRSAAGKPKWGAPMSRQNPLPPTHRLGKGPDFANSSRFHSAPFQRRPVNRSTGPRFHSAPLHRLKSPKTGCPGAASA